MQGVLVWRLQRKTGKRYDYFRCFPVAVEWILVLRVTSSA